MTRLFRIIALSLALIATSSGQTDFIADYLNGKVFGASPGPCPNSANRCSAEVDPEAMPLSVQQIQVTLFEGFCFGLDVGLFCIGYDGGFTRPLGGPNGWLQGGDVDIWELRCEDMGLDDLTLFLQGTQTASQVFTTISTQALRQKCDGQTRFNNLAIEYSNAFLVGDIRMTLTGQGSFETDGGEGLDFSIRMDWYADKTDFTVSFEDTIPSHVVIPISQCNIATQDRLGLELQDDVVWDTFSVTLGGYSIPFGLIFDETEVANFFLAALEATLGITICELLAGSTIQEDGSDGYLNEKLDEYYNEFYNVITVGQPDDVLDYDQNLVFYTGQSGPFPVPDEEKYRGFKVTEQQLALSVNFNESSLFEIVSVGVNEWLNEVPETRIGLQYPKNINEVIERMLGTEENGVVIPDGFGATFFDLQAEGYYLSTVLELSWARLNISLERIDFQGLNTVTEFGIFENNFCTDSTADCDRSKSLEYTLNHSVAAADVTIGAQMRLRLLNDEWVTYSPECAAVGETPPFPNCELDSTSYTFFLNLTLEDFALFMTTTQAFNPDLLDELQIGQFTGIDFGGELTKGATQILNCIAPGFYTMNCPNLNFSVSELSDPEANFGGQNPELSDLINNAVVAFNTLVGSAFKSELPEFVQSQYVRGELNVALWDTVDQKSLQKCDPYIEPETNLALDFENGVISYMYPIVNKVLGGAYITTRGTETDINDLIQIIMEYLSDSSETFIFRSGPDPEPVQGTWLTKTGLEIFGEFPAYSGFGDQNVNKFNWGNPSIFNLNQIEDLQVRTYGFDKAGFDLVFAISNTTIDLDGIPGGPTAPNPNPFTFSMDFNVISEDNFDDFATRNPEPINDKVTLTFTLQDMDMYLAFDQIVIRINQINQLRLRQVRNSVPCILSALESFEVAESSLQAEEVFVNVSLTAGPPVSFPVVPGSSTFGQAIQDLAATLTVITPEYKAMVNTILNNSLAEALRLLVEENFTRYEPDTCDDAEDDPIGDYINFFSNFQIPNVSDIVGECIDIPDPPLSIGQAQAAVTNFYPNSSDLDWQTSLVGQRLESALGTTEGASTLNSVLVALANTSGSPLADAFYLEDDMGTVSMNLVLNRENFFFDLFDFEPLVYTDLANIIPGYRFEVENLTVVGINRFVSSTTLFEALSEWIFQVAISFDDMNPLDIQINGFFEADPEFRGLTGTEPIREQWTIATQITGFDAIAQVLAAIDLDIFVNRSLGHYFDVTEGDLDIVLNAFADECLFALFFDGGISFPLLNVSIGDMTGPTFTSQSNNYFSPEFENVVAEVIKLITKFYIDAIPNIFQNCVRGELNYNLRQKWIDSQNGACPDEPIVTELPEEDQYFRFGTAQGNIKFQEFMRENLYVNEFQVWNDIIAATTLTNGNPSKLYAKDENELGFTDYEITYNDVGYGFLNMSIYDLYIDGLDTFSALSIFEPITTDNNYTTLDGFIVGAKDRDSMDGVDGLTFIFTLSIETDGIFIDRPDGRLDQDLAMVISFKNLTTFLEVFALVNTTEALNIRFSSVSSLNEVPCLLAPIDALEPVAFELSLADIGGEFSCNGACEFPALEALAQGGKVTLDSSPELAQLINDAIQYLVDYVTSSGAQSLINAQLEVAEENCAELLGLISNLLEFETDQDVDVAQVMGIAFAGVFAVGCFASCLLCPLHKQRRIARLARFKMTQKLMAEDKERLLLENEMKSIFAHPITPRPLKVLVPIICLLHIIGLVFAITGPAINIIIQFTVFGATTQEIVLVPFSVVSTINDIWNSGAWPLALLIGIASCAWPIIKNAMLFVIFFCPSTILSRPARGRLLTTLDILGKWSFLDVFIVVMTLAALRTYLQLSAYSRLTFLPADTFQVDVNVTPEYGIVLLCFIASTSLIINHVQSYYHTKSDEANQAAEDHIRGYSGKAPARATKRVAVMEHFFAGADRRGRRKRVSRNKVKLVIAVNLFSGLLTLIGVILPVITFNMSGLIGLLLGSVSADLAVRTYSIVDLGAIVSEAPANDSAGYFVNTFFQFLFFLNSVVFPMLLVIVNTLMLSLKLTLKEARSFHWLNLIVSFWAALDCFIVAIVMTLIEIKQITVYIVNFISDDFCANVEGLLIGLLGEANGACLDVSGNLEIGALFLFTGVFVQVIVTVTIVMLVTVVLEDRYFQSYNGLRRVQKPSKPGFIKKAVLRFMTKITRGRPVAQRKPNLGGAGATASISLDSAAPPRQSGTPSALDQFYNSPGSATGGGSSVAVSNPMMQQSSDDLDI